MVVFSEIELCARFDVVEEEDGLCVRAYGAVEKRRSVEVYRYAGVSQGRREEEVEGEEGEAQKVSFRSPYIRLVRGRGLTGARPSLASILKCFSVMGTRFAGT